jgi:methyl coenzyme M reductase alpha subunit
MKAIYLTAEAKEEIENRIDKFKKLQKDYIKDGYKNGINETEGSLNILKEILSSATILPVETESSYIKYVFDSSKKNADRFPNGVIIQPKQ